MVLKVGLTKFILPVLLILSMILLNTLMYFSHQIDMYWMFNSDVALIPAMYKDLIINNGNYSLWHLPAAPYLFPDVFLFFCAIVLSTSYYVAAWLFFTFQIILILYAVYLINQLFFSKLDSLKLSTIVVALLFIIPTLASQLIYFSVFHVGEFIVSLFSIYFVMKIIVTKENDYLSYVFLILLSALTLMSDTLYLLHFILPTLIAISLLFILKKIKFKKALLILLAICLSVFISYLLYKLFIINPNKPKISLQASDFAAKFSSLYAILLVSFKKHTISTILIVFVYIASLVFIIVNNKVSKISIYKFIIFYLLAMFLGNILAAILLENNIAYRYMIPLFLLPIITLPLILNILTNNKVARAKNSLSVILFVLIGLFSYKSYDIFTHSKIQSEFYPEEVKCFDDFIDETHSKFGVSGYWMVKKLFILSKHDDVTIGQILFDLNPYKWVSTDNWYQDNYNFFIIHHSASVVHRLDVKIISEKVGEPDKIYNCPKIDILYYKNGFKLDT